MTAPGRLAAHRSRSAVAVRGLPRVVIWLVASEAIELPVPLPIDAHPDRFLLARSLVGAALVSVLGKPSLRAEHAGERACRSRCSRSPLSRSSSLAANAQTLASLGELEQGRKQFALLLSIVAVFFVVATVIRP